MKKIKPGRLLYFFLMTVLMTACLDIGETGDIQLNHNGQEWAVPLVRSSMSVEDLLGDLSDSTDVFIDSSGLLHLQYVGDLLRKGAKEIFPPYPPGLPIEIPDTNSLIDLPFKELIITDMNIKGDSMFLLFRSDLQEDVDVYATIPALSVNGQTFSVNTTIKYDPARTLPFDQAIVKVSLAGYRLQMDNNSYRVIYDARKKDGTRIKLSKVILVYNTLDFEYIEGFFSKDSYSIPRDTIAIDVYDRLLPGSLYFEAPSVAIRVSNAFGFPLQTIVKELRLKGRDGQFLELESPYVEQGFNVAYPGLNEVGEYKVTEFVFDTSNSNIKDIFNSQPVEMDYEIMAIANPDQNQTTIGFLQEDTDFRVNVRVDLPVHGRAEDFEGSSDFDIDLGATEEITRMEIKWISENRMPVALSAQAYFYNTDGGVVDSLFYGERLQIDAAPVDANDQVIQTVENVRFEELTGERLDRIRGAATGKLSLRISTYDPKNRSVRILKGQEITIKIGAIIQTNG